MVDNPVPGPRVLARIDLLPTFRGGLNFSLEENNRSLIFVFPPIETEAINHGAMFEKIYGDSTPGCSFHAVIQFFDDSAAISATPGVAFHLWLGGIVGSGEVLESVGDP